VGLLNGQVAHRDGDLIMVRGTDPGALNARLVAAGIMVRELTPLRRSLEQVVLELTGPSADRVDR
jgi:ABC-2 type transport system ATP-binding protein